MALLQKARISWLGFYVSFKVCIFYFDCGWRHATHYIFRGSNADHWLLEPVDSSYKEEVVSDG